jgi:hypothetical protein
MGEKKPRAADESLSRLPGGQVVISHYLYKNILAYLEERHIFDDPQHMPA